MTLERKYGDSLNFEDLHGRAGKAKKRKEGDMGSTAGGASEGAAAFSSKDDLNATHQTSGTLKSGAEMSEMSPKSKAAAAANVAVPKQSEAITVADQEKKPTKVSDKRKADTDCKNEEFENLLNMRNQQPPKDYQMLHGDFLKSISHGRPPQERLNIPEGVDVFQYGNQKLNIWEFQKEQLR